jgi:hypothetical protein
VQFCVKRGQGGGHVGFDTKISQGKGKQVGVQRGEGKVIGTVVVCCGRCSRLRGIFT